MAKFTDQTTFNVNRHHLFTHLGASSYNLNLDNTKTSAEYYHQLRSNIVHSGKNIVET